MVNSMSAGFGGKSRNDKTPPSAKLGGLGVESAAGLRGGLGTDGGQVQTDLHGNRSVPHNDLRFARMEPPEASRAKLTGFHFHGLVTDDHGDRLGMRQELILGELALRLSRPLTLTPPVTRLKDKSEIGRLHDSVPNQD